MIGGEDEPCGRCTSPKDTTLADAKYDLIEVTILEVARHYWQTFAMPETQSWLRALQCAETRFPGPHGGEIALETLATVQAMRVSRTSNFRFNNPNCPCCSQVVGEHERQFMSVFQAVRSNRVGLARTFAMLLCEGNNTDRFLMRMAALAKTVDPGVSSDAVEEFHPQMV
ncbi:MAG: hypothetical protein AAF646_09340 [Pseudomonadota bacterium]